MYSFLCVYQPSCLHSCSPRDLSWLAHSTLCWFTAAINNSRSLGRGWISISQGWAADDTHKMLMSFFFFPHLYPNTGFMHRWQGGEEGVDRAWKYQSSRGVPGREVPGSGADILPWPPGVCPSTPEGPAGPVATPHWNWLALQVSSSGAGSRVVKLNLQSTSPHSASPIWSSTSSQPDTHTIDWEAQGRQKWPPLLLSLK